MSAEIIALPSIKIERKARAAKSEELTLFVSAERAAKLNEAADLAGCISDDIANRILNILLDRLEPKALFDLASRAAQP